MDSPVGIPLQQLWIVGVLAMRVLSLRLALKDLCPLIVVLYDVDHQFLCKTLWPKPQPLNSEPEISQGISSDSGVGTPIFSVPPEARYTIGMCGCWV